MTTEQEMERIVRSWLEPGLTTLTDDVLDPVLDQLPATPQRRPLWSSRRIAVMNPIVKFAIATAAVVVIAIVGYNLLGASGSSKVGSPTTPAPTSSLAPLVPESDAAIEPGRYRWISPSANVSFDIPQGWIGRDAEPGYIEHGGDNPDEYNNLDFTNARYEDILVYGDACKQRDPVLVGDTVSDLVAALDDQRSTDAVVGEIGAGSVTGKRIEIKETPGLDGSQCGYMTDAGPVRIWSGGSEEGNFLAWNAPGQALVYVFDVDGNRLVFSAGFPGEAPEAQLDEVDAIVESMEFSTP